MISDEQLEKAADIDVAHPDENVMVRAAYIKEMAQELLQRRQADRAIWENAPEWANWYARDKNGQGYFYEKKPWACVVSWRYPGDGRVAPIIVQSWQSTLQERPK